MVPLIPKKTKIDFNIDEDGASFGQSFIGKTQSKKTLQQAFEFEDMQPIKKAKKRNF